MGFLNKFIQSIFGRNDQQPVSPVPRSSDSGATVEPSANMSTLDFMSIPAASRRILRILLRKSEISDAALRELVAEMPDDKRPSEAEYEEALTDLTGRTWVLQYEMDGKRHYRVNLGAKTGSDESRSDPGTAMKRDGPSMPQLWDAVDTSETD